MYRPEKLNTFIVIQKNEVLTAYNVFIFFRELGHHFIVRKYNESYLIIVKWKIMRYTPFTLMCVIHSVIPIFII